MRIKQREVILAKAYRGRTKNQGEGDAKASALYGAAFGQNPEFYAFYRSLEAYKQSFKNKSDVMVLDPSSAFSGISKRRARRVNMLGYRYKFIEIRNA